MLAMPEIQIRDALRTGLSTINARLDVLDDIFANHPEEMRAEARKFFTENSVEVVLNWPRESMKSPTIAIVNASDSEAVGNDTLGDVLEELEIADTDPTLTEYRGIALNGTYQLLILTSDPRLTLYLSYIVFTLLVLNADSFQRGGMHNIVLGGADLRFEEGLLPEWSNSRMVTLTCLHYHAVPVTERLLTLLNVDVRLSLTFPVE